ncbi:uncharacterized protein LOC114712064 [Neltuma alba]|uniref:uncharacterized protein LOC114712064 n=1 Tax=Neltuma alba TaxID=207710 RepID=UPI0010A2D37F|nr:uncharacterized protein LOC114712064 [Prosopis alba]
MEYPYFPRNYDGRRHRAWNPSFTDGDDGGGSRRHQQQQHRPKHHVAFKAEQEEIISTAGSGAPPPENGVVHNDRGSPPNSVDDEAGAFIKHEHDRIQLARLRSINPY